MKTITLQEYLDGTVKRTAKHPTLPHGHRDLLEVWAIGLGAEAGEAADLVKKYLGHGHKLDRAAVMKEVGDVSWYLTALAWGLGGDDAARQIWAVDPEPAPRTPESLGSATRTLLLDAAFGAAWSISGGEVWQCGELEDVARALRCFCALLPEPFTVEDAWAANAAKLAARYPDGFDPKRSQARLAPKIYVASKFRNHLAVRAAQAALRAAGCSITYDWTPHVDHPEMEADQQACALADAKGVLDADALLLIRVPEMRGAYVEMGMALAKGIPVHIVQGDRGEVAAQVFEHHPLVQHHPTVEAAVAAIYSGATTRKAA